MEKNKIKSALLCILLDCLYEAYNVKGKIFGKYLMSHNNAKMIQIQNYHKNIVIDVQFFN